MQPDRPKYVIVNEYDAPEPRMVCQWVPGVGYCYMDRTHGKSRYDGMTGSCNSISFGNSHWRIWIKGSFYFFAKQITTMKTISNNPNGFLFTF